MEEKDKKIQDLTNQVATLTGNVTTLTKERDDATGKVASLEKTVQEKDVLIEQKNKDIVGARKEYKKLSDMTQAEKDAMTEAELELKERQERFEADQQKFQKEQKERQDKEVKGRQDALIARLGGKDPKIAEAIRANLGKLNPELLNKAITEEEIRPLVETAVNMLGTAKPNPVQAAANGVDGGEAPGEAKGEGFAESKEGSDLSKALGLPAVAEAAK